MCTTEIREDSEGILSDISVYSERDEHNEHVTERGYTVWDNYTEHSEIWYCLTCGGTEFVFVSFKFVKLREDALGVT